MWILACWMSDMGWGVTCRCLGVACQSPSSLSAPMELPVESLSSSRGSFGTVLMSSHSPSLGLPGEAIAETLPSRQAASFSQHRCAWLLCPPPPPPPPFLSCARAPTSHTHAQDSGLHLEYEIGPDACPSPGCPGALDSSSSHLDVVPLCSSPPPPAPFSSHTSKSAVCKWLRLPASAPC